MSTESPPVRQLVDPATGRQVELVYALPPGLGGSEPEAGTSPLDLLRRIIAHRRLIAAVTGLGIVTGLAIALALPNRYTASATALPPADKGGGGMMAQYASLAAAAGMSLPSAPTSSIDAIMAILGSRRLAEPLIDKFGLREEYRAKTREDALRSFAEDFTTKNDKKSNTVTISFTHKDPKTAAAVTNAAADMLRTIFNEISQGNAGRERAFLEKRQAQTEAELLTASKALAEFQAQHNAIEIESQTKATIEAVAKLQGELMGQQIELRALLASQASEDNPRIQLLQERVNAVSNEMQQLLGSGSSKGSSPSILLSLNGLPEIHIAYLEHFRAVKRCEAVLVALTTQLESSRINEVRSSEVVTIIDPAFIPERKSGPPRAQICIAATILGLLAGCAAALAADALRRARPQPSEPAL